MNTREICLKIIEKLFHGYTLESITENLDDFKGLSKKDKAFVKMLILTFLRRNGEVDFVIKRFVKKPLKEKNEKLKNILRIGITQILFLEVSDHAATFTTVEITKKHYFGLQSFVNAVLRNVCRNKLVLVKTLDPTINLPKWVTEQTYSDIKININDIAKCIRKVPFLDIHFKNKQLMNMKYVKDLKGKNIFNNILRIKHTGGIENIPRFQNGEWWIQSVSASIPCIIIEKIFNLERKKIDILEIGSAPGGKTIQLCNAGFQVTAIEKSLKRTCKLKENLKRMRFRPKILNVDILNNNIKKLYDCALIDAPCSASGIIQKKPEILIQEKNIHSLLKTQQKILEKTSKLIKKNGIMIYAVCSLIFKEGEGQINNFLKKNDKFIKVNLKDIITDLDCLNKNGNIIMSPLNYKKSGGVDGFFISCLKNIR